MWSRRQFLASLGGAGASALVTGFAGACGSGASPSTRTAPRAQSGTLEQLLESIDRRLEEPYVWSRHEQRYRVTIDSSEKAFDHEEHTWVVFGGLHEGAPYSAALLNPSSEALSSAARAFIARFPGREARSSLTLPERLRLGTPSESRLQSRGESDYQEPAARLFEMARKSGSSRIVFRASYLESSGCEQRFLSRKHNQRIHSQRTQAGVLMAAWTGEDVATARAQVSGLGGPKLARLSEEAIEGAAEQALSHLHARSAPSGVQDVLLSPEAAATLAYRGVARAAPALLSAESPLRIVDDPRAGYAAIPRDAMGEETLLSVLLAAEAAPTRSLGQLRRDHRGLVQRLPTNVVVTPGEASLASMVESIDEGVLLVGPLSCSVDLRGQSVSLLASSAREIRKGRFTGRLFGRVLLSARRDALFADTRSLGQVSTTLAFEDEGLPMSVRAPHWLSRARVEAG